MSFGNAHDAGVAPGRGHGQRLAIDGRPQRGQRLPKGRGKLEQEVRCPSVSPGSGAAPGCRRAAQRLG
eukprot:8180054-Alexandrium_andersonii.AAC.1